MNIDTHTEITELQDFLSAKAWLRPDEHIISLEKPGEGNMNVVLRISTDQRTFVLKQSRPYVQKYQQIAAPIDRIATEHQFYSDVQSSKIAPHMPRVLGYDPSHHLMLLEDLGSCEDMTYIYQNRAIDPVYLDTLIQIIGEVHKTKDTKDFPENRELRELNHQHIFVLPFLEENGFSLDEVQPGLQSLSQPYKKDLALKKVVEKIGLKYLALGNVLLHGDYYPGSWMTRSEQLYVLDPEFSFVGFAEFDLGVLTAHLILATHKVTHLNAVAQRYQGQAEKQLIAKVAGIEIMRRLIGLAQLPLTRTIAEKDYLLQAARKMVLT
ncbi:phosphotransferase [Flavobacteriaceae bacterium 3-367]|uniref:phosphotransferase n=1 Tax=Eudoraea algarum TaxID=3417568 RepID=UPI00328A3C0E